MTPRIHIGITDAKDRLTAQQKASFTGDYKTYVLPVGFKLWRFISKQKDHYFSDYWIDNETMTKIMSELHTSQSFSQEFKKTNIRNSLAILEDWSNKLHCRVRISLQQEVIAYVGTTGKQKGFAETERQFSFGSGKVEKLTDVRQGGHNQYVIPRFYRLPNENKLAKVELVMHI
jgi:predicted DNA-binding protein YlxM (UPF0122 family)